MKVYVLILYSTRWSANLDIFDSLEEAIKARDEARNAFSTKRGSVTFKIQEMSISNKFNGIGQERIFVE